MTDISDREKILRLVDDYFKSYVAPEHPRLSIPDLYDLECWEGTPAAKMCGCYAFFNKAGDLLYVGKSDFAVENRIWSWVQRVRVQTDENHWTFSAAAIQIVNVKFWWEAPSLEAYLIDRLRPRGNTQGMRTI